jgi:hypothetical protein
MSQNPLMHSSSQFSKTPSLKPALASTLASLEVQLDRELARYRRYRGKSRTSNQVQPANSNGSQLQYSTSTNTNIKDNIVEVTTQPVVEAERQEIPVSHINSNLSPIHVTEIPTPPPPPPLQVAKVAMSVATLATESTRTEPNTPQTASIVPAAKPKAESNSNNSDLGVPPTSEPDDYLESSEALLRSLAEEAPKEQKQKANNSLLSPLGIGSILLLLMASLILASAIINPKSLPFRLDGLFRRNNPAVSKNSETVGGKGQISARNVEVASVPKYPNLARKEFPEVNNPNDVIGLKPKSSSNPITTNSLPIQNKIPQNQIPTQQIPQNQIPQNQIPTQQIPRPAVPIAPTTINPLTANSPTANLPSPQPTQEVPISQIKPSADGFYHIVIDNTDPNAFANARKAVPDAYISDDKKLILLGAMKDKNGVQELLNEVKAKGINARIRQP